MADTTMQTSTPAIAPTPSTQPSSVPAYVNQPTTPLKLDSNNMPVPNSVQFTTPAPATSAATPSVISADALRTPTTPLQVPQPSTTTGSTSVQSALTVNPPPTPVNHPGIDSTTGLPNPPQPAPAPAQPSVYEQTLSTLSGLNSQMAGKSAETTSLQNTYGLDQKTQDATTAYNAYHLAQVQLNQQIASIQENKTGMTQEGVNQTVANAQRIGNANLANLAVISQAASGNLEAAQSIIKAKLDAEFGPVQDQIDNLGKFIQVNNQDLTQSQQTQLENQRFVMQTNMQNLLSAKQSAHSFALTQGIQNPSVLSAIDNAQTPAAVYAAVGMNNDGSAPSGTNTNGNTSSTNANGVAVTGQLASSPYAAYVTQSNDGTQYVNQDQLKNLTPYQQQEAARQYASAGIKVLQPDEASKIQNIDVTKGNLQQLKTVTDQVLSSGLYGRTIGAAWNKISALLQTDTQLSSFNSYRDLAINAIQALAGGSGSGFRLNQAEIDTAVSNIPTISDNRETADQKITNLNSFLNKWTKELLPTSNVSTGVGTGAVSSQSNPFSASNFYGQ